MGAALEKLIKSQRYLVEGETDRALAVLQEFEESLQGGVISKSEIPACTEALQTIRVLADAAREGVAAAQKQIAEVLSLSKSLGTYDEKGRKLSGKVSRVRDRRY